MKFLLEIDNNLRRGLLFGLLLLSGVFFFSTGSWLSIFAIFFSLGLLIYSNSQWDAKYFKNVTGSFPSSLQKNNFNADESFLSDDFITGVAINYDEENIAVVTRKHREDEFDFTLLPFSTILESEIREDNQTLLKASKGGAVGGALVGGALAGGVGAIVGGLSASRTGTEKAHRLTLIIVVDDIKNPVYEINFINNPDGTPKSSPLYEDARSKATKWHKTISVILKKNNMNTSSI